MSKNEKDNVFNPAQGKDKVETSDIELEILDQQGYGTGIDDNQEADDLIEQLKQAREAQAAKAEEEARVAAAAEADRLAEETRVTEAAAKAEEEARRKETVAKSKRIQDADEARKLVNEARLKAESKAVEEARAAEEADRLEKEADRLEKEAKPIAKRKIKRTVTKILIEKGSEHWLDKDPEDSKDEEKSSDSEQSVEAIKSNLDLLKQAADNDLTIYSDAKAYKVFPRAKGLGFEIKELKENGEVKEKVSYYQVTYNESDIEADEMSQKFGIKSTNDVVSLEFKKVEFNILGKVKTVISQQDQDIVGIIEAISTKNKFEQKEAEDLESILPKDGEEEIIFDHAGQQLTCSFEEEGVWKVEEGNSVVFFLHKDAESIKMAKSPTENASGSSTPDPESSVFQDCDSGEFLDLLSVVSSFKRAASSRAVEAGTTAESDEHDLAILESKKEAAKNYKYPEDSLGKIQPMVTLSRHYRDGNEDNEKIADRLESMYYALQTKAVLNGCMITGYSAADGFSITNNGVNEQVTIDQILKNENCESVQKITDGYLKTEKAAFDKRSEVNTHAITQYTRGRVRTSRELMTKEVLDFAADENTGVSVVGNSYRCFRGSADGSYSLYKVDKAGEKITSAPHYKISSNLEILKRVRGVAKSTNADLRDDAIVAQFFAQVSELKEQKEKESAVIVNNPEPVESAKEVSEIDKALAKIDLDHEYKFEDEDKKTVYFVKSLRGNNVDIHRYQRDEDGIMINHEVVDMKSYNPFDDILIIDVINSGIKSEKTKEELFKEIAEKPEGMFNANKDRYSFNSEKNELYVNDNDHIVVDLFEIVSVFDQLRLANQEKAARKEIEGLIARVTNSIPNEIDSAEKARRMVEGFFGISAHDHEEVLKEIKACTLPNSQTNHVVAAFEEFKNNLGAKNPKTSFDQSFLASYGYSFSDGKIASSDGALEYDMVTKWKNAAEKGNPVAQKNLGRLYEKEIDVITNANQKDDKIKLSATQEENNQTAFVYYVAAAKHPSKSALEQVVRCYKNGVGVNKNTGLADQLETLNNLSGRKDHRLSYRVSSYNPQKGFSLKDFNNKEVLSLTIDGTVTSKSPAKDVFKINALSTEYNNIKKSEINTVEDLKASVLKALESIEEPELGKERIANWFCNIPVKEENYPYYMPKHQLLASVPDDVRKKLEEFSRDNVHFLAGSKNEHLKDLAGQIYFNGVGVEKNYSIARTYFEEAAKYKDEGGKKSFAKEGYKLAQYHLGMMYLCGGQNIPQDYKFAAQCFESAANNGKNNGFQPAVSTLATLYAEGTGVERSQAKADELLKRSRGQENIGMAHVIIVKEMEEKIKAIVSPSSDAEEKEVESTNEEKFEIQQRAISKLKDAAKYNPKCYEALGDLYLKGDILEPNGQLVNEPNKTAEQFYKTGSEVGSTSCMRKLAGMYKEGSIVVDHANNKAMKLINRANLFDELAMNMSLENNTIKIQTSPFGTKSYKVSKSGNDYIISEEGKEKNGFRITSEDKVYKIIAGQERYRENKNADLVYGASGLYDPRLIEITKQIISHNSKSAYVQIYNGVSDAMLNSLTEALKRSNVEEKQAKEIAYDFLGVQLQDRGSEISQNAEVRTVKHSFGNYYTDNLQTGVQKVLEEFMRSRESEFVNSEIPHLQNILGVYQEMCGDKNAAAESYQKAADKGYIPAEYRLVNIDKEAAKNSEKRKAVFDKLLPIANKGYLPAIKAVAEMVIDAETDKIIQDFVPQPSQIDHAKLIQNLAWAAENRKSEIIIEKDDGKEGRYSLSSYDLNKGFTLKGINNQGRVTGEVFRIAPIINDGGKVTVGEIYKVTQEGEQKVTSADPDISKISGKIAEAQNAQKTEIENIKCDPKTSFISRAYSTLFNPRSQGSGQKIVPQL